MARIGVVLHGADDEALRHAEKLAKHLTSEGHSVVAPVEDSERTSELGCVEPQEFANDLDLAVSLGGDGTILRTVALLDGADVKILGVNFGDLGYLTVIDPHELDDAVERCLNGDHDIEERMLVSGTANGTTLHALNDIVVERAPGNTTVRIGDANHRGSRTEDLHFPQVTKNRPFEVTYVEFEQILCRGIFRGEPDGSEERDCFEVKTHIHSDGRPSRVLELA